MKSLMELLTISFKLNGRPVAVVAEPMENLRDVLREKLQVLTVKAGCGQGGCGSCTVLINGEPVVGCLTPIANVRGAEITTLEGIGSFNKMHPLQQAFYDNFAAQCGYCTSGMITVAKALLDHNPHPSHEEIVDAFAGNVCRCTGYVPIIQAIEKVANR